MEKPDVKKIKKTVVEKGKAAQGFVADKSKAAQEFAIEKGKAAQDFVAEQGAVAGQFVKESAERISEGVADRKQELDLKRLNPVFEGDLTNMHFPPMIRIVETDSRRMNHPLCKGSIGFMDTIKEMQVFNIYQKDVPKLNIWFYPTYQEDIYYVDPCNQFRYISLNDYFQYLRNVRVAELSEIAKALGAKYLNITLLAEKKTFVDGKGKVGAKAGKESKDKKNGKGNTKINAGGQVQATGNNTAKEKLEVLAEMKFPGSKPRTPEVRYFRNDPDIKSLVNLRLDPHNPITEKTIELKYNQTTGINLKTALKIDGVLKKLKVAGDVSVEGEIKKEEKLYFKYEVRFPE